MIVTEAYITYNGSEQYKIDNTNLRKMTVELFDRGDFKKPSYGVYSNKGSITFIDKNDVFLNYFKDKNAKKELPIFFKLINTNEVDKFETKGVETIGKMVTKQWDYDSANKTFTVTVKDDIEQWQAVDIPLLPYDRDKIKNSLLHIYNYLRSKTPHKNRMLELSELDEITKKHIVDSEVNYLMLFDNNLWADWNKLCNVLQLHIYNDNLGKIQCKYLGGD